MSTTTIELQTPPTTSVLSVQAAPQTEDNGPELEPRPLQKGTTAVIFATVTGVTGISSLLAGLVTVTLPRMAQDLELPNSLLLWYFYNQTTDTVSID